MSNETSEWKHSPSTTTPNNDNKDSRQLHHDQEHHHHHHHFDQQVKNSPLESSQSSWVKEFPLPQESVASNINNAKTNSSSNMGVGDLLNKKQSPPSKSETENVRSYAFVTDFPSPQEASKATHASKSMGVSDLINHYNHENESKKQQDRPDPTVPPHPQRSFANVAGNKDFPSLESTDSNITSHDSEGLSESLSSIPDVKDMLGSPSIKVKPPPPSQSFAKMAAKPPPPKEEPNPRKIAIEKQNQEALENQLDLTTEPGIVTHENFPTLAQANHMYEQGASASNEKDKAMYTEISKISDAADAAAGKIDPTKEVEETLKEKDQQEEKVTDSFAKVTAANLDKAPPSAASRPVPRQPQYDEQTMLNETMKQEAWKSKQNNDTDVVTPEQILLQERKDDIDLQKKNEALVVSKRIARFDRGQRGKITMLDTFKTLRGMGYSFIAAIPITILMHLRLSPLTSPYQFPFLYRSAMDYFTLPIYTSKLVPALAYGSSATLFTGQRGSSLINRYGREQHGTNTIGLTFWDGIRGMSKEERLQWWQVKSWVSHRLQWMAVYTMLQNSKTHLITADALSGLPTYSLSI